MTPPPPRRVSFLCRALGLMNVPYLWGGKDSRGIDCSGVVTLSLYLAHGPDWRQTHNTDVLWNELTPIIEPRPGDLAFYGRGGPRNVSHVMVVGPLGIVFGASGGDSGVTSVAIARQRGAKVKAYDDVMYRPDFRGYRRLPVVD